MIRIINIIRIASEKTEMNIYRKCRFDFLQPIIDNVVLRNVITSIVGRKTLRSKLYDLPRKKSERFINDYNPVVKRPRRIWTYNLLEKNQNFKLVFNKIHDKIEKMQYRLCNDRFQ